MNRTRSLILSFSLILFHASIAVAVQPPVVIKAVKKSNTAISLTITINNDKIREGELLILERSGPTGPSIPIAEFAKLKKTMKIKDKSLFSGKYRYRLRIKIKEDKFSKWYKSDQIIIANKKAPKVTPSATPTRAAEQPPQVTPTATPATPQPTPTPTPVPTPDYEPFFDSNGNATAYGKKELLIPSNFNANINAGSIIARDETCGGCHALKNNTKYPTLKHAIGTGVIPPMKDIKLTDQQFADLTAYLNQYR